jgi:membrane protein involved in colicin uptake
LTVKRLAFYLLLTLFAAGSSFSPAFAQAEPGDGSAVIAQASGSDDDAKKADAKKDAAAKKAADAKAAADAKKEAAAKKAADAKAAADAKKEAAAKKAAAADAEKQKKQKQKDDAKAAKDAAKKTDAKDGDDKDDDKKADAKKADDKKAADKKADDKKSDDSKAGDDGEAKPKKAKSSVPLGTRLASFTCGAVLGYPVAMAKRTVHQTKAGTKDFVGETHNPIKLLPAVVVSVPYGVVGGFLEGWQYSVMNSWKASGEDPFSKETFSLDD